MLYGTKGFAGFFVGVTFASVVPVVLFRFYLSDNKQSKLTLKLGGCNEDGRGFYRAHGSGCAIRVV